MLWFLSVSGKHRLCRKQRPAVAAAVIHRPQFPLVSNASHDPSHSRLQPLCQAVILPGDYGWGESRVKVNVVVVVDEISRIGSLFLFRIQHVSSSFAPAAAAGGLRCCLGNTTTPPSPSSLRLRVCSQMRKQTPHRRERTLYAWRRTTTPLRESALLTQFQPRPSVQQQTQLRCSILRSRRRRRRRRRRAAMMMMMMSSTTHNRSSSSSKTLPPQRSNSTNASSSHSPTR